MEAEREQAGRELFEAECASSEPHTVNTTMTWDQLDRWQQEAWCREALDE